MSRGDAARREYVVEASTPPERIPALYSRAAWRHDLWAWVFEGHAHRLLLERAAGREGEALLELGCGSGGQLVALARENRSGRVAGVDVAPGMLAAARHRLDSTGMGSVELHEADARELPFAAGEFDVAVGAFVLDLLPRADIPRVLGEVGRVLAPGGRVVLASMTRAERRRHGFWDALYARGLSLSGGCRGVLAAPVLAELGFADVRREYLSRLLLPIELVTAHLPR